MSVFKVKLTVQNESSPIEPQQGQGNADITGQGNMDEAAQKSGLSIQRTMFAMGPNKINRKLVDGATFTDCNYWKRFCATPTGPLSADNAFIALVTDDGSAYVDGQVSFVPRIYNVAVGAGSTFATAGNSVNVLTDNGGAANFASITNSGSQTVKYQLNGLSTAVTTLTAGSTVTYNPGDFQITSIQFADNGGGATTVVVTVGFQSVCNS